jgi:hypothetical protein
MQNSKKHTRQKWDTRNAPRNPFQDDIIALQAGAVVGLDRLASRADAAAAEAEARWAAVARGAEELGEWQRRSESFQVRVGSCLLWGPVAIWIWGD